MRIRGVRIDKDKRVLFIDSYGEIAVSLRGLREVELTAREREVLELIKKKVVDISNNKDIVKHPEIESIVNILNVFKRPEIAEEILSEIGSQKKSQYYKRLCYETWGCLGWDRNIFRWNNMIKAIDRWQPKIPDRKESSSYKYKYDYTVVYSCDRRYFDEFVISAIASSIIYGMPGKRLHFVIVTSKEDKKGIQEAIENTCINEYASIEVRVLEMLDKERFKKDVGWERSTALCCARFIEAANILRECKSKWGLVLDADQLFIKNIKKITDKLETKNEVAAIDYTLERPYLTLNGKIGASFVLFSGDINSIGYAYMENLGEYLKCHFENDESLWTIDQLGLLHVKEAMDIDNYYYSNFEETNNCGPVNSKMFGSTVLFNQSGASKFRKNAYTTMCKDLKELIAK